MQRALEVRKTTITRPTRIIHTELICPYCDDSFLNYLGALKRDRYFFGVNADGRLRIDPLGTDDWFAVDNDPLGTVCGNSVCTHFGEPLSLPQGWKVHAPPGDDWFWVTPVGG